MKNVCLIFCFVNLFGIGLCFSQSSNDIFNTTATTNINFNSQPLTEKDIYNASGSRYFYDDNYHAGELWTKTGYFNKEMVYRFDQLEGTIQIKTSNGKETLVDEKTVIMFHLHIKDKTVVFVRKKLPEINDDLLLQVIYYSPNLQLLRNSKKSVYNNRASYSNGYDFSSSNLTIANNFSYFITKNDNTPLEQITITERSFLEKFPKHRNKIVQFFKTNDTKKELSLNKIINLLDKITEQTENALESYTPANSEIRGSRYFYDERFHGGELWTKTEHYKKGARYKYDQVEGILHVQVENEKEKTIDEREIVMLHLQLKDYKEVFVRKQVPNAKNDVLLQVLYYSPNLQFLRNSKKTVARKGEQDSIDTKRIKVFYAFDNNFQYYITKNDYTPLEEIELTEASFIQKFPKSKIEIAQFFKENGKPEHWATEKFNQLIKTIETQNNK